MRPGSAGGCLPPSARTCGSGREVSAGAPRAASGVRRVGPPASPPARGTASRRDSPVPEAPVPCDSHPSLPPSVPAPATRDLRVPGTRKRPPLSAQDAHVPGAREPGTGKRPPRGALDTLIPVHGDPVRRNGLPPGRRTPISLVHGNPVQSAGLSASLPPLPALTSPPVPPVPCPPQWRGGRWKRRAPPRGPFIGPPPSRAVKVGQDRGTVRTTPIGRRPGAPAAHWLRREDGARRRRVRHGRQSSKKLG